MGPYIGNIRKSVKPRHSRDSKCPLYSPHWQSKSKHKPNPYITFQMILSLTVPLSPPVEFNILIFFIISEKWFDVSFSEQRIWYNYGTFPPGNPKNKVNHSPLWENTAEYSIGMICFMGMYCTNDPNIQLMEMRFGIICIFILELWNM